MANRDDCTWTRYNKGIDQHNTLEGIFVEKISGTWKNWKQITNERQQANFGDRYYIDINNNNKADYDPRLYFAGYLSEFNASATVDVPFRLHTYKVCWVQGLSHYLCRRLYTSPNGQQEVYESFIPNLRNGPRVWYNDSGPSNTKLIPNQAPSQWTPTIRHFSTDFHPGGILWKSVRIDDRPGLGGRWVARRHPAGPWLQCTRVHHQATFRNWLVAVDTATNKYKVLNTIDWSLDTKFATCLRTFNFTDTVSFHFTFSTLTLLLNLCVIKKDNTIF